MVNNTYWRWQKILPKEFCDYIVKSIDWEEAKDAIVGAGEGSIDKKIRFSQVSWADQFSVIGCIAQSYAVAANRYAGWNYDMTHFERVQQTKYTEGGHYSWHKDTYNPDEANQQRKLSVCILLNDPKEFEGGKFQFKDLSDEDNLLDEQGTILVFPSFIEHRVTPIVSGTRYSAVAWAVGNAFR
jgi:PKHD-type hydroxylase